VSDEKRAPVSELLGADPDWCGGQSVDEYVRSQRDRDYGQAEAEACSNPPPGSCSDAGCRVHGWPEYDPPDPDAGWL
jgi:hypothetical protein